MKKKFLLIFLFLLLLPFPIFAINDVLCKESGMKERRYLWYTIEENSQYFIHGENTIEYPFLDETKWKKTDYTNWVNVEPEQKKNRSIEERTIYSYKESYPVRYFYFTNFSGFEDKLFISELSIFDQEKKVPYEIFCTNCSDNFIKVVSDGNWEKALAYLHKDSILKIKLLDYIPSENFRIYLYTKLEENENPKVEVKATEKDSLDDIFYQKKYFLSELNFPIEKIYFFNVHLNQMDKKNPRYKEEIQSLEKVEERYNRLIKEEKEYRYQDVLYRYYFIKKLYNGTYTKEGTTTYPYKDSLKYLDFYLCEESSIPIVVAKTIEKKNEPKTVKITEKNNERISKNEIGKTKKNKNIKNASFLFCILLILLLIQKHIVQKIKNEKFQK